MIDALLAVLEVPAVGHGGATDWRIAGLGDFEDALQVVGAIAGAAAIIVSRNAADCSGASIPVMTPEDFLAAFP